MPAKHKQPIPPGQKESDDSGPSLETITLRLYRHVLKTWGADCVAISVHSKSRYVYIGATPREMPQRMPSRKVQPLLMAPRGRKLCRIHYLKAPDSWGFAFYKYSDEKYELSMYPSGRYEGTPEEAFDCAAHVYLTD